MNDRTPIGDGSRFAVRTRRVSKKIRKIFGGKRRREISELSTSGIHQAVLRAIAATPALPAIGDHLDVGSGTGELLRLVRAHHPFHSFGCDYTDKLLSVPGADIQTADLNRDPLPYGNNRFALITCIETVEHLENFREVVREIYRVLEPGGVAIFSTPNILNLRSRLRYRPDFIICLVRWHLMNPLFTPLAVTLTR